MKNMKWKSVLALLLAVAIFAVASRADAWVKVTVRNNRSHNLSIAFRWDGFDGSESGNKGWFTVNAGQSRTITLDDAVASLTMEKFGYYATGGGSAWRGNNETGIGGWIHPRNAFDITTDVDGKVENAVSGMEQVLFRRVNLSKTGDRNMDATATLTFNP